MHCPGVHCKAIPYWGYPVQACVKQCCVPWNRCCHLGVPLATPAQTLMEPWTKCQIWTVCTLFLSFMIIYIGLMAYYSEPACPGAILVLDVDAWGNFVSYCRPRPD